VVFVFRSRTYDAHAMSSFCTADRFSDMTNTWMLPSGNGTRLAASAPCSDNQNLNRATHHSIKNRREVNFPTSRNLPRNGSVAENAARNSPTASDLCE
jgi:hypothetical protein